MQHVTHICKQATVGKQHPSQDPLQDPISWACATMAPNWLSAAAVNTTDSIHMISPQFVCGKNLTYTRFWYGTDGAGRQYDEREQASRGTRGQSSSLPHKWLRFVALITDYCSLSRIVAFRGAKGDSYFRAGLMARSNSFATREFCRVILSEAKDLGKLGRFFAALRMTDGAPRCSFFGTGPTFSRRASSDTYRWRPGTSPCNRRSRGRRCDP